MYELGHVLLLFWCGQVRVVGSQGVEDGPAVAAQFLTILRTIFPKFAAPLQKEVKGQFSLPGPEAYEAPLFPSPEAQTPNFSPAADPALVRLKEGRAYLGGKFRNSQPQGRPSGTGLVRSLGRGVGRPAPGACRRGGGAGWGWGARVGRGESCAG